LPLLHILTEVKTAASTATKAIRPTPKAINANATSRAVNSIIGQFPISLGFILNEVLISVVVIVYDSADVNVIGIALERHDFH
jgi:hypothetical protein